MDTSANIYDICDDVILKERRPSEPGRHLRLLYQRTVRNLLLKIFVLRACRHPAIPTDGMVRYRAMMRAAMRASHDDWHDPLWIRTTFQPIADLLDTIEAPRWQLREPVPPATAPPTREAIAGSVDKVLEEILRVWDQDARDPYFPVAAQIILSGDDHMDGENFMSVLCGLGSFEYQNLTMLLYFVRCFIMAHPRKLRLIRKPFTGVSEPMFAARHWIMHRTAYYDAMFLEHLLTRVTRMRIEEAEAARITSVMENLVSFVAVASREWLVTPHAGIKHPAITCLPKGEGSSTLCRLSKGDWKRKTELGFGDYLPDTDTTFLGLSVARKWMTFVEERGVRADRGIVEECGRLLNHPYVDIVREYQVGGPYARDLPTIHITKPLDYEGAVPIWFERAFEKPDGRIVRRPLGNEICPGHNMDILESILVNRDQWHALAGRNLDTVRRLLEFHYRAFSSGAFGKESAFKYYLPEMYVYLTGRMYAAYEGLSAEEKRTLDPDGKIEEIRDIAIAYCRTELLGHTLNEFDAALAVAALVFLRYGRTDDGVVGRGVQIMCDAVGDGRRGGRLPAYEWARMRHPTRIIVGSSVATALFVMNALVLAHDSLDE